MSQRICGVCYHSYDGGEVCPRCRMDHTSPKLPKALVEKYCQGPEVRVHHENFQLDEQLGLMAYKSNGHWFVNVNTYVSGIHQYAVIAVPLSKFRDLIDKCAQEDRKLKK